MRVVPWKALFISLGVAGVVVWRVPISSLRAAFANLELGNLLLALLCFAILLLLRAYKWHQLLVAAGQKYLRRSLRCLFGGFALGLITPGRLGELGRCAFVRRPERASIVLLTLFDRLLDFWALLTAMGVSLFFLAPHPAAIFGVAVWLALLPVLLGFPVLISHLAARARESRHFRAHFLEVAEGMPSVPTPRFAVLAIAATGAELAAFFFLLRAFFPAGFTNAVATYPYIVLAGDLPVSFSGVGVREGAAALMLSAYSVPYTAAVDACLLWFIFATLLPAAAGAVWLLVERARSQVRRADKMPEPVELTWAPLCSPQPAGPLPSETVTPSCEAR